MEQSPDGDYCGFVKMIEYAYMAKKLKGHPMVPRFVMCGVQFCGQQVQTSKIFEHLDGDHMAYQLWVKNNEHLFLGHLKL